MLVSGDGGVNGGGGGLLVVVMNDWRRWCSGGRNW